MFITYNKKLKIAVFHNLGAGGAIKVLHDHIVFLKNEGHMIDVFIPQTADDNFAPLAPIVDNFTIFPIKNNKLKESLFSLINKMPINLNFSKNSKFLFNYKNVEKTQKEIANTINKLDYDIVFCEQDAMFAWTPSIFKYLKKPVVYYCQQPMRGNTEKVLTKMEKQTTKSFSETLINKYLNYNQNKYIKLDILNAQYVDNILVNSYFSHENVLRRFGKNSQVSYLGIDNKFFKHIPSSKKDYILSVGGLIPNKGFDFIIESLSKVDNNIKPKLLIVGYGGTTTWTNYLKDLAIKKEVDLTILENVTDEELLKLYNEAKIFVFGSILEPFGLVSLEAMACGTPVIGVKEGGIMEIIQDHKNGLLIPRDKKLFSSGIVELLTNKNLYEKLSKNGIKYVNDYWTTEDAGRRLINHMYRIIEEKKEN